MQVDDKTFIVNSLPSMSAFLNMVPELFKEHRYLTFTWRIGEQRSLSANALLHVWITDYCADLAGIHKKDVTAQMIEFLKRKCKAKFYHETGADWMVSKMIDPTTGEEGKPYYVSSSDYKVGEMFQFLTWLQMTASNDGVILESRGEYKKLQDEQEG